MARREVPPSLKDLSGRLEAARARQDKATGRSGQGSGPVSGSGLGFGLRIAVDLLAGLAIGVVLGLLLDNWLGTAPLMMVVLLFLGAAAGMLNVYRAATGRGLAVGYGGQAGGLDAQDASKDASQDRSQDGTPRNGDAAKASDAANAASKDRGGKS